MDQLFEAVPIENEKEALPEPKSSVPAVDDDDTWHRHLASLDGFYAIGANGTKRPREAAPPGIPPDESGRPQQRSRTGEEQEQEPEQQNRRVTQILRGLERVPPGAMSVVLANVFTITHRDFPLLSRPIPPKAEAITSWPHLFWGPEAEADEEEEEEDLYSGDEYQRPWIWEKVMDAAEAFQYLSNLKWEIKETEEERRVTETVVIAMKDTQLMRTVWRQWLDGAGGGEEAGFCTGAATFFDSCKDQEEIYRIVATPKWYTHGFLGSVVLHRALLNSARNVTGARDILQNLNNYIIQHPQLQAHPEQKKKYLWTVRTPEWINRWIAGDIPTPDAWLGVMPTGMRHPPQQWPLGWFAPQLAHGFLYLDLLSPERTVRETRLPAQLMQSTESDWFIHPRAVKHLQFMRTNMLDSSSAVPMVVRLPAELVTVLGAGSQIRWGYTVTQNRKSWVTRPRWEADPNDSDLEVFSPSHPKSVVSSVGLVISGIRASAHNRPPMLGLVMPDEPGPPMLAMRGTRPKLYDGNPKVTDDDFKLAFTKVVPNITTPEELGAINAATQRIYDAKYRAWAAAGLGGPNATDNFEQDWHSIVTDVWMADIRLDSPSAILLWLSRVGARYHPTLAVVNASTARSIEPRLSDQPIPSRTLWPWSMLARQRRMAAGQGDYYYPQDDGKTLILSRCWTAPAHDNWLRGRNPSPQFYDHERGLWVLDVGDSTAYFQVLMLLRCHGGPALPTLLPDLGRLRYLAYTVPVYRLDSDPQQEDLRRIANHGRIDRLLMFPKQTFILDRVGMSRELFTNAQGWISGYAFYQRNLDRVRQAPPTGWLQRHAIDKDITRLNYKWDQRGLEKVELDYWRIHRDIDDLAKRAWREFRLPWWKGTRLARTSLPGAVELVHWAKDMGDARSVRVGLHNLERVQWTNMLFAINRTGSQGAYTGTSFETIQGDPLGDWMHAMDRASPYVTAAYTGLTLHKKLRYLGPRVSWGTVAFGTHDPTRGLQLSVRLGMTELPWRGGHEGSPALFDRLMSPETLSYVRNETDGIRDYDIVDLSGNPIDDNTRSREAMVRINRVYSQLKRDGMMVLIGPSKPNLPTNRLCQLLRRAAASDENFSLGVFEVDSPETLIRTAMAWASRRLDLSRADRLVAIMMHYRPPRNLEQTLPESGGDDGVIKHWPQSMVPEVVDRVNALSKSNPYGESADLS